MKIVLVDGVDTYQAPGIQTIHLGVPLDVPDEIGAHLLTQRCQTGPMFLPAQEMDRGRVLIRLTESSRSYRSALVFAEGCTPVEVPASVAPYLLRLRREGRPVFVPAGTA